MKKVAIVGAFLFCWAALPCTLRCQAAAQTPLPSSPSTGPIVFTEDFSTGFQKWDILRNSAQYWSIVDGQAEAYIPRGSTLAEMIPLDSVWDAAWKDIEYELDYTPLQGMDKNISFGFENVLNWYEIHFVDTFYHLVRIMDGQAPFSVFEPYTMANGRTYKIKIRFFQGKIEIFVDGEKIADKFDFSFNNNYGKIGIKAGTGAVAPTRVRFDNIVVRTLTTNTSATVELLKQTDPQWKDHEYDTATLWSEKPTIGRWGCAMTSMVMIMRFHGIKTFADGTPITPATLNAWLKQQADGYIGEGALNWLAVTRLTKQLSAVFGTPKLEYNRVNGSSIDAAKAELTAKKPVILQIPGHFLVADGITDNQQDLRIKDPAYTYTTLSQHNQSLLSTRTFQPSQTDLSYFLVVSNKPLQIKVKNASGTVLAVEENKDEIIDPLDNSGEKNPAVYQYTIPKPESGTYGIEIANPSITQVKLELLTYDETGLFTQRKFNYWLSPTPLLFKVEFNKSGQSKISQQYSFSHFKQDLFHTHGQKLLTSSLWKIKLDRTAELGQAAVVAKDIQAQRRYAALLTEQLSQAGQWLKPVGREFLSNRLTNLKNQLR